MDKNYIKELLNRASKVYFAPPVSVKFKINNNNQIVLDVSGLDSYTTLNYNLNGRIIKKKKSESIIRSISLNTKQVNCIKEMLELLTSITCNQINWEKYSVNAVKIDESIIEKAELVLKEHIESVQEIYLEPLEEKINTVNIEKSKLNDLWEEHVLSKHKVVENISSFRKYKKITRKDEYPYLILSTPTGEIKLSEETTGHFIKVKNNEAELERIKNTESILDIFCKNIESYSVLSDYIRDRITVHISNIEQDREMSVFDDINCKECYLNKVTQNIKMSPMSEDITIYNKKYNLKDILEDTLEDIENEIDAALNHVLNQVKHFCEIKIKAKKQKFEQEYVFEVLTVIDEFPKKGITTYVSILAGDNDSKITSNRYNQSLSYGKMSDCTKVFITKFIRGLIGIGLIEESSYKASFGRYIGLTLSKESKNYIDNHDITNVEYKEDVSAIKSLKELIEKLRSGITSLKSKSIILSLKYEEIEADKEDVQNVLNFIEIDRPLYRDYEDCFVKAVSKIVPQQYKPIFLLNSNLSSGVVKKTLKSIYDEMN